MKTILTVIITMFFVTGYAQNATITCTKGRIPMTPEKQFNTDLKNNNLKVYTLGGIVPPDYEAENAFKKKYGIDYYNFGCLAPVTMDFYIAYNRLVFEYLSEQNINWKEEISANAMGFTKWKETSYK